MHNGALSATDTTFAGNSATGGSVTNTGGLPGDGYGGAIFNLDGAVTLTNDTIADNEAGGGANEGDPGADETDGGGAVYALGYDQNGATDSDNTALTLVNDVLTGSTTTSGAATADLVLNQPASVTDGSSNADVVAFTSTAPNVATKVLVTGVTVSSLPQEVAAGLSSTLADNGGPGMLTLSPLPGSVTLGDGTTTGAPSADERGIAVPAAGPVDLGAVEPAAPAVTLTTPADGDVYALGAAVTVMYTCSPDPATTVASCSGTTASGTALPTSTPGAHTFAVTATDALGGRTTVSHGYTVTTPSGTGTGTTTGAGTTSTAGGSTTTTGTTVTGTSTSTTDTTTTTTTPRPDRRLR